MQKQRFPAQRLAVPQRRIENPRLRFRGISGPVGERAFAAHYKPPHRGLVEPAELAEDGGQMLIGLGEIGIYRESALETRRRFVEPSQLAQGQTHHVMRLRNVAFYPDGLPDQARNRLRKLLRSWNAVMPLIYKASALRRSPAETGRAGLA